MFFSRALRFRWYQGFVPDNHFAPEWAIDNVFIGMACMDHCLGHGTCADTMMCACDQGHGGDSCSPLNPNLVYLKENFKPINVNVPLRGLIGQHNLQGKFYVQIVDTSEFYF